MNDKIEIRVRSRRFGLIVFKDFVHNENLSYDARMLWLVMYGFSSKEHSCVWPSTITLRNLMKNHGNERRLGKEKLFKLLKELEVKGYLKRQLRKKGRHFTSALYTLFDEPCFTEDSLSTVHQDSDRQNPDGQNPDERYKKVRTGLEGDARGRGGEAPTKQNEKRRKIRGAAPHPAGASPGPQAPHGRLADPDGSESSSSVSGETGGGSAPCTPGVRYPEALIQDGKRRSPRPDDPEEVRADFFLYHWREKQFLVLNKRPMLKESDREQTIAWIREAQPVSLRSYMALAVVAWETRMGKSTNNWKPRLVAAKHSKTLSSFLRNLDKIEEELEWDHDDRERHEEVLESVVTAE